MMIPAFFSLDETTHHLYLGRKRRAHQVPSRRQRLGGLEGRLVPLG